MLLTPAGPQSELGYPYALFVGRHEPRKNLDTVISSVGEVRKTRPELLLAVAGAEGPAEDGLAWLGYVPDEQLASLYRGASALVYPSRFEGFGLPIVEAMACGAPVVASNTSCFPEVVGNAGVLLDPRDVQSWADAFRQLLGNSEAAAMP